MGNTEITGLKSSDLDHMRRAAECAMDSYNAGNCAVGAVITLGDERIAEGGNSMIEPQYNPLWHAEMTTISRVPIELWTRARDDLLYHPRALRHVHDSTTDARLRAGCVRLGRPGRGRKLSAPPPATLL